MRFFTLLAFLVIFLLFENTNCGTFTIDYPNHQFLKDGKSFRYISGDVHYARIHPDLWDDRLKRVRSAGLNAIQIYAPWNLHEPVEGTFDFSGMLNISRFLSLAQENGLYVLFRPGPYICAEWENGGLPWWLLNYDGIRMRTSDPVFLDKVGKYFNRLFEEVEPYMYQNGGPILMVQIENEYGALNACDHTYLGFMRDLIWNKIRDDVLIYTTDNAGYDLVTCSHINGTFPTVDFGPDPSLHFLDHHFDVQQNISKGGPNICSEYYVTWFTAWGQKNNLERNISTLMSNFNHFYYAKNASWNIYMIHGGTNFGFNVDGGLITSYDYGAPISENGEITPIYTHLRSFIQSLPDWEYPPGNIPANNPSKAYGHVTMKRLGSNLLSTLSTIQETCHSFTDPLTFEQIRHPYGYVLYSTVLKSSGTKLVTPYIQDMGFVYVNNVYQGWVKYNKHELTISAQPGDNLRILVENFGRADHWRGAYPILEKKGLFTNVTLNGALLQNWLQCGINLTSESVNSLSSTFYAQDQRIEGSTSSPGVFTGSFTADPIQDTWLDSSGWGKGQLFVNGFNLGRYWPQEGPQMTLYVPSPILKPQNTILMIELLGSQQNFVNLVDRPIYVYNSTTIQ